MSKDEIETIFLGELDESAQAEVEKDTDDEDFEWYASPNGDGTYALHPIRQELRDLFFAQGGPADGWMRVVYQAD